VKRLWEQKGIRFPGRGILPNSSSAPTSTSTCTASPAELVLFSDLAMPKTFEEENMFLELGIKESLKSSSSTVKHIQESPITYNSKPDTSEPDVNQPDYGLSLLFTAAKIVGD